MHPLQQQRKKCKSFTTVCSVIDEAPRDVLYVMGDWNAKVGSKQMDNITRSFGLGERNKRGDDLIEFCSQNNLRIMNTYFQMHPRRLYTWESPD